MPSQGNEPLPCAKVMFFSCLLVPGYKNAVIPLLAATSWLMEKDKSCLLLLPTWHPDRIVAM